MGVPQVPPRKGEQGPCAGGEVWGNGWDTDKIIVSSGFYWWQREKGKVIGGRMGHKKKSYSISHGQKFRKNLHA